MVTMLVILQAEFHQCHVGLEADWLSGRVLESLDRRVVSSRLVRCTVLCP